MKTDPYWCIKSQIQHQIFCDFCSIYIKIQGWNWFYQVQIFMLQISRFPMETNKLFFGITDLLGKAPKLTRWENSNPITYKKCLEQLAQRCLHYWCLNFDENSPIVCTEIRLCWLDLPSQRQNPRTDLLLPLYTPFPWCCEILHKVIILQLCSQLGLCLHCSSQKIALIQIGIPFLTYMILELANIHFSFVSMVIQINCLVWIFIHCIYLRKHLYHQNSWCHRITELHHLLSCSMYFHFVVSPIRQLIISFISRGLPVFLVLIFCPLFCSCLS